MLKEEILDFAAGYGRCAEVTADGVEFIRCRFSHADSEHEVYLLPMPIRARSVEAAGRDWDQRRRAVETLNCGSGKRIIAVAEDWWRRGGEAFRAKLAAHFGVFRSVFARNCEVRKVKKAEADAFLKLWHNYASASCRYCYGLFEKKSGELVAVATFSNARRWVKPEGEVRSYEWVRYASGSDVRVVGGMGKLLKKFIEDVSPDDIMSYADLEWSDGEAYRKLGFIGDGRKAPVLFEVDPRDWTRKALPAGEEAALLAEESAGILAGESAEEPGTAGGAVDKFFYKNFGSIKYRLKIIR